MNVKVFNMITRTKESKLLLLLLFLLLLLLLLLKNILCNCKFEFNGKKRRRQHVK